MILPARSSHTTRSKRLRPALLFAVTAGIVIGGASSHGGEVALAWDPVPGASGYYIDYGTDPDDLTTRLDVGTSIGWTVRGLTDCTTWFFTVSAYDASRLPGEPSLRVSGWPRPELSSHAIRVKQGEMQTIDIFGANFRPATRITIDNPEVQLQNVVNLGCFRTQLFVSVGPAGPGVRPAEIGSFRLQAVNLPVRTFNRVGGDFVVEVDPRRFDLDRSNKSTEDRIDGADLSRLTFNWGGCDHPTSPSCDESDLALYLPDLDFNGDGWIDGEDLTFIVLHRWGRCWSPQTDDWTDAPSVHPTAGLICPTVTP